MEYERMLKTACQNTGCYHKSFRITIKTLADILEQTDRLKEVIDSADELTYIDEKGVRKQIPEFKMYTDLCKTALQYYSQLGLTAKGLNAIDKTALEEKKADPLAEVLKLL